MNFPIGTVAQGLAKSDTVQYSAMLSAPAIGQMLFDARTYYLSVLAGARVSSRSTLYTVATSHSASLAISSVCMVGCFDISVVTFFHKATFSAFT